MSARSLRLSLLTSFAIASTAIGACGTPSTKDSVPAVNSKTSEPTRVVTELPELYRGQTPRLPNSGLIDMLPDDSTILSVMAHSPRRLQEALGTSEILKEYGTLYQDLSTKLTEVTGANLLETANWGAIGIDPDGPLAFSVLWEEDLVAVFSVDISDLEAFRKGMMALGKEVGLDESPQVQLTSQGMVLILGGGELALIIRGRTAMLVLPDRRKDLTPAVAKLSGSKTLPTLAQSGRVAKAFATLEYGEDISALIAFDTIAKRIIIEERENDRDDFMAESIRRLERDISEAQRSGADEDTIRALEEELAQNVSWVHSSSLRNQAEIDVQDHIIGAMGSVGVGIDLDGPTTRFHVSMLPGKDTLLRRILSQPPRPFALASALRADPLFVVGGRFDATSRLELLDLLLRTDGNTVGELRHELRKEIGVDLEEALGLLGGEISGAMTADMSKLSEIMRDPDDFLGFHIYAEVEDEAKAQALLERASQHGPLSSMRTTIDGRIALDLSGLFNRPGTILRVVDGALQLTSGPASGALNLKSEEKRLLGAASTALFAFDPLLTGWFLFGVSMDMGHREEVLAGPVGLATEEKNDSAKQLSKERAMQQELEELRSRKRELVSAQVLDLHRKVGRFWIAARPYKDRTALLGGIFGESKSLARSFQAMIETFEDEARNARQREPDELSKLNIEIRKLEEELWQHRYGH